MKTIVNEYPDPIEQVNVSGRVGKIFGWLCALLLGAVLSAVLFPSYLLFRDVVQEKLDAAYYHIVHWGEVESRLENLAAWRREAPYRVRSYPGADGAVMYLAEIPVTMGWAYCGGPGFSQMLTPPKETPKSLNGNACFWMDGSDQKHRFVLSNQTVAVYTREASDD